jgi:predicted ATPase
VAEIVTVAELGRLLRGLRHRQARRCGEARLTYRELAARTGWSRGIIGEYLAGHVLPPTDRFDVLTRLLGATPTEQGLLATARDRVEEYRRNPRSTAGVHARQVWLPAAVTGFLGRDGEVRAVVDLLAGSGSRLVTLTGPGGVGKTRLALEVASQLAAHFVDGVALVSLACVRDPGQVVAAIADTLGVRQLGAQSLVEILHGYLRTRRVLLVLDNVEQLLPAVAPQLAALLAAAPRLGLLVTSRSLLRVQGEWVYPVGPLGPAAAAELFVQRATQAGAQATGNLPGVVAEICRRLDHLPLAIELAAARVRVLPPATLLAGLDPELSVLGRGPLDLPERQQTLRQTVAWSHELLNPAEQAMLRATAVFSSGWTLVAAAAVAQVDQATSVELHAGLVDASLITLGSWGTQPVVGAWVEQPRFHSLDTIRSYAAERLHASGEHHAVRDRHADYYRDWARAAAARLWSSAQSEVLEALQREHANLRGALRRLLDRGDLADVADACAGLALFWTVRGHWGEGQAWAEEVLAAALPATSRAKLLVIAGWLRFRQGYYDKAAESLAEAARLAREVGEQATLCQILSVWASVEVYRGRLHAAVPLADRAEALAHQLDDVILLNFVVIAKAHIAIAQDRLTELNQALTAHSVELRAQGIPWTLAVTLGIHGRAALLLGDYPRAQDLLQEGVLLSGRLRDTWVLMHQLTSLADAAALQREPQRAAMMYGVVDVFTEQTGATIFPVWRTLSERCQQTAIAAIGLDAFQQHRRQGRQLPLDDVITLAAGHHPTLQLTRTYGT